MLMMIKEQETEDLVHDSFYKDYSSGQENEAEQTLGEALASDFDENNENISYGEYSEKNFEGNDHDYSQSYGHDYMHEFDYEYEYEYDQNQDDWTQSTFQPEMNEQYTYWSEARDESESKHPLSSMIESDLGTSSFETPGFETAYVSVENTESDSDQLQDKHVPKHPRSSGHRTERRAREKSKKARRERAIRRRSDLTSVDVSQVANEPRSFVAVNKKSFRKQKEQRSSSPIPESVSGAVRQSTRCSVPVSLLKSVLSEIRLAEKQESLKFVPKSGVSIKVVFIY